jgi:hypothetical protein
MHRTEVAQSHVTKDWCQPLEGGFILDASFCSFAGQDIDPVFGDNVLEAV